MKQYSFAAESLDEEIVLKISDNVAVGGGGGPVGTREIDGLESLTNGLIVELTSASERRGKAYM